MDDIKYQKMLGINFLVGDYKKAKHLIDKGKLMVMPAAPALATIREDVQYYDALKGSDFAIPDSGLMVLILKIFKNIKLKKMSGLKFLKKFLEEDHLKQSKNLFLIDPNDAEKRINHHYLLLKNIKISCSDHYVAPLYDRNHVRDEDLLRIIESKKPKYILINLGGGVQEKLGLYLKKHLHYSPGIICSGAAIAFLTGKQAHIPPIADKFHMGWFLRCLNEPKKFVPRYLKGFFLIPLILKAKKER